MVIDCSRLDLWQMFFSQDRSGSSFRSEGDRPDRKCDILWRSEVQHCACTSFANTASACPMLDILSEPSHIPVRFSSWINLVFDRV